MRKGRVSGSVLVNVETRRPVDLVPFRNAWLQVVGGLVALRVA